MGSFPIRCPKLRQEMVKISSLLLLTTAASAQTRPKSCSCMKYERKLVNRLRDEGNGHVFTRKEIKFVCGWVKKLSFDTYDFTSFRNGDFEDRFCPAELGDDCMWKQKLFQGAAKWCDDNEEARGPWRNPTELELRTVGSDQWIDDCEQWLDAQDDGECTDAVAIWLAGIPHLPGSQFTYEKARITYHYFYTQEMPANDFREFCPDGGASCYTGYKLEPVHGYGCWCNLDDRMMIGRGKPVDMYDEYCKNYQLCVRCAKKDGEVLGYECKPKTKDFKADFSVSPYNCNVNFNSDGSVDKCGNSMCECYSNLVDKLATYLWVGPASNFPGYDIAYNHIHVVSILTPCVLKLVVVETNKRAAVCTRIEGQFTSNAVALNSYTTA